MPGKKAPNYFPLNLNMSGIGKGSYYGDVSPVLGYHHGKYDNSGLGMIMGSPINTLTNNSPNTNPFSLSEYINLNGIPPVNSEDEEEDEDDFVSHSGSESVSIQGSDDLDVDIDDVDSLVLNIRDKLQMAPNSTASMSHHHWTSVGSLTNNGTNNDCMSPSTETETNDLLIHNHHHHTSPHSFPNSSSVNPSTSGSSSGSAPSGSRRRRNHPYTHVRSLHLSQLHRKQSSSSSGSSPGNSSSPSSGNVNSKGHNSYYRRFHPNPPGSIGKTKSNSHQKNWWAASLGKGCGSGSNSLSKQFSRTDDPYQLLQELLESGSLIKEAVRRLNRKCLNSSNTQNPSQVGTTPNNSISTNVICSSSSTGSTSNSSSSTRFSFNADEDTENSYPVIPISNQ